MIEPAHRGGESEPSRVGVDDVQGRELRDRAVDALRLDANLRVEPREGPRGLLAEELRDDAALCIRVDSLPRHAKLIVPSCGGKLDG
jgi:hypothetical protein